MQLSKETIKLLFVELNELLNHFDLTEKQGNEIYALMESLPCLYMGEPLEITLADE
jgi:hypothetical protein